MGIINIYFSEKDIPATGKTCSGYEDIMKAIGKRVQEINTTQLNILSYDISRTYDYHFHINGKVYPLEKKVLGTYFKMTLCSIRDYIQSHSSYFEIERYIAKTINTYSNKTKALDKEKCKVFDAFENGLNVLSFLKLRLKTIFTNIPDLIMYIMFFLSIPLSIWGMSRMKIESIIFISLITCIILYMEVSNIRRYKKILARKI